MTQKTFYHLHFITSSMFYGMCFTLRYYNLSELSQALKQTLQVGSELVILLAPRLSCMAHMAAQNNLNGPPPIKKQITTSACIKRSRQEWEMGIFFLICTANKWDSPSARLLTVLLYNIHYW